MPNGDEETNEAILMMLLLASIIDGHLSKWRIQLLTDAAVRLGKELDISRTHKLAYNFKMGLGITIENLAPCFLEVGEEKGAHALTCSERFHICLSGFFSYLSWFS